MHRKQLVNGRPAEVDDKCPLRSYTETEEAASRHVAVDETRSLVPLPQSQYPTEQLECSNSSLNQLFLSTKAELSVAHDYLGVNSKEPYPTNFALLDASMFPAPVRSHRPSVLSFSTSETISFAILSVSSNH